MKADKDMHWFFMHSALACHTSNWGAVHDDGASKLFRSDSRQEIESRTNSIVIISIGKICGSNSWRDLQLFVVQLNVSRILSTKLNEKWRELACYACWSSSLNQQSIVALMLPLPHWSSYCFNDWTSQLDDMKHDEECSQEIDKVSPKSQHEQHSSPSSMLQVLLFTHLRCRIWSRSGALC